MTVLEKKARKEENARLGRPDFKCDPDGNIISCSRAIYKREKNGEETICEDTYLLKDYDADNYYWRKKPGEKLKEELSIELLKRISDGVRKMCDETEIYPIRKESGNENKKIA